jgi:citrate lyase subunit beta/citryl-CoA lyase
MRLRSLLFVPGDRPDRMDKAAGYGADALILDLEDAVAQGARPAARGHIAALLMREERKAALFVRINPLDNAECDRDLDAMADLRPDGIVLPKASGAASIHALVERMAARRIVAPILPIATETPAAIFHLGSYRSVADHLCGLTWGAEDLPAAMGAVSARAPDGSFLPPYEIARSLMLFGAHAAGVPAIETVFPAFGDLDGLALYARRSAEAGFTGMMAIHPAQIAVINHAFTPSAEAIAHARAVVSAFQASPGAGVLQVEGRMVDAPHLKLARQILQRAGDMPEA